MVNSAASAIIREGATQKLQDVIVAGQGQGMQFMDDAIWKVLQQGIVTPHEAYMKAIDKNRFKKYLPAEEAELGNSSGAAPDDSGFASAYRFVSDTPPRASQREQAEHVRETARRLLSQAYLAGLRFPDVVKLLKEADRELAEGPRKKESA